MRGEIIKQISQRGLHHGHSHYTNHTIEFIQQEFYQSQIAQGKTRNTMPFNAAAWSFDPKDYLNDPQNWKVVVRLIDLDRITIVT